jgi:hypothetical protein
MKLGLAFFAAIAVLGGPAVVGAERQPDPPLVVNGEVSLTTVDFEAYIQKVPENMRDDFRASLQRVKPTVDALWVQRAIAAKARAAGLADDPVIAARARQAQDIILAEAYLQREQRNYKLPDLTARAEELYKTRPEEFKVPERVRVQHILVATSCRGREEALERAKQIRARVAGGDEAAFLAEVQKSSDDQSKDKNKGDLGMATVTSFEAPFAAAVTKMKPGEISEPIETKYGFHIVRFLAREPARMKSFAEVKDQLIAGERQKLLDEERTRQMNLVRDDPKTHLYLENVEALTRPRNQAALSTDSKKR